jgi:hypothetical protein
MAEPGVPWYVRDRSVVTAKLHLTRRGGVRIVSLRQLDDGDDLVVEVRTGDGLSTRMFVVQVRGTLAPDPADWTDAMARLLRDDANPAFLPVCAFVIHARDERGIWAWISEPVIRADGPGLHDHLVVQPRELDAAAAAGVIDQTAAWYEARARQLQPA